MELLTTEAAARFLAGQEKRIILLTHRRPDGDTAGCAAALCRGLRQLGKTAHIAKNPELTPRYAWLHQGLTVNHPPKVCTLVSVDTATPGLVQMNAGFPAQQVALRIDHHPMTEPFGRYQTVDPSAGACGEILLDILTALGVTLDKPMADALYTAVATDTGCFRFANTTARSFAAAAACAAAGADIYGLNQALFDTISLPRLRMQGWVAENTLLVQEGRGAVCAIPKATEQALGVSEDDMDNLSSFVRSIEGVQMGATLRERKDGIRVSVRAVPGYDAGAVCARFGGGGHAGAAGATIHDTLENAAAALAQAVLEALS